MPQLFGSLHISKLTILSPFATADYDIESLPSSENNKIRRTIRTDKVLTDLLAKELALREINSLSDVVVITERDTDYGRKLAENFCDSLSSVNSDEEIDTASCRKSNVFYYLRGIDAYEQTLAQPDKSTNKQRNRLSVDSKHNPPVGPSQYDYLRRLSDQIRNLSENNQIKAIGIFGTDIYDKLLILQALRQEFRHIVFFTTGLDAQMIHPQHWRWTKNLVVASSFDLKLKKELQNSSPAFRDSYQTSLYLSTLIAAEHLKLLAVENPILIVKEPIIETEVPSKFLNMKFEDVIQPLIFEIGRNGPVRLIQDFDKNHEDSIHPSIIEGKLVYSKIAAFGLIFLLLICIYYQTRPKSGVLISSILVSILILFIIFFPAIDRVGNPLSLTDGVSMWPTIFLRAIVFLLIIVFLSKAIRGLEINFSRLSKEYFGDSETPLQYPTLYSPTKLKLLESKTDFFKHLNFIIVKKEYCWALLFVVMIVAIKSITIDDPRELLLISLTWLVIISLWFLGVLAYLVNIKTINQWVESGSSTNSLNLEGLWKQYYQHGRITHRVLRTVTMFLLFMASISILFYLLPVQQSPCRGITCDYDKVMFTASFTLMMLLIFFAVDAQRLCIYWVQKLRTEYLLPRYGSKTEEIPQTEAEAEDKIKELKTIINLVAERTNEVDRLIYYPLIVIILMLFARNNYFDDLGFPQAIGIIVIINISILIAAGLKLRNEAFALRSAVVKSAQEIAYYVPTEQKKIDLVKDEIQSINYGAFLSLRDHPVIRVILLVLGSIGLTVAEYKFLFG